LGVQEGEFQKYVQMKKREKMRKESFRGAKKEEIISQRILKKTSERKKLVDRHHPGRRKEGDGEKALFPA